MPEKKPDIRALILVVEDEALVRMMLVDVLDDAGFKGTDGNFVWGHYDDLEGDIAWHAARNPAFPTTCSISCWPELTPNPHQQYNRSASQTAHAAKFAKEPFSVAGPRDL